jgi:hypothetical protein
MRKPGDRLEQYERVMPGTAEEPPSFTLGDICTVRVYLDEREVEFVRWARQQEKSWSEIAASIGVTRQAAWESGQDLNVASSSSGR